MNFLITGASGFIGSKLCQSLAKQRPESHLVGVGRSDVVEWGTSLANFDYISCDLLEDGAFVKLPGRTDVLIHLAGDPRTFLDSESCTRQLISNVVMTSKLADYARASGAHLFVFSSSVYVYSGNSEIPFSEGVVAGPCENLGVSKLAAESILRARAVSGDFKTLIFRIFTVYGPGSRMTQFIPQAVKKLLSEDTVGEFGSPDVKRDFVYVDDVVRAFGAGIDLRRKEFLYEILNVGSGISSSIGDVVSLLAELTGSEKRTSFSSGREAKAAGDTDHCADITRIRSVLGWEPKVNLRDGLRRVIDDLTD